MRKGSRIAWIDDNPGRKRTAEDLGAEFIDVKGVDLGSRVEKLLSGRQRSLVIVDHILDKTSSTSPMLQLGSTIAEAIKGQWPSCPVIGVTNADIEDDIDVRTRSTYDDLIAFSEFGAFIDRVKPIARDFARVTRATRRTPADLIELLKPPPDERDRLVAVLPDDLKRSVEDASVPARLYRWVKHVIERPGFLYDESWTATLLGLNVRGFRRVASTFEKALYSGVFAREDDRRWWTSRVTDILYKEQEPRSGEMSWHVGRRLHGIRAEHFSRCHACNKDFPEVVAFLDASTDERHPMHLRCTVLHPRFTRELYFDDVRMMKGVTSGS